MDGSTIAIWAIIIVVVVGLVIWLVGVSLAARKPHPEHVHGEKLRGRVQGATHVAEGGRSVAPRRDEEVIPDEPMAGDTR